MKKAVFLVIFLVILICTIKSDDINFPPELTWWINELEQINSNVEVNKFISKGFEKRKFIADNTLFNNSPLQYPVFMRWNYSGNIVAYYDYHEVALERQKSGRYKIGYGNDLGRLFIADRNKNVFFVDYFGITIGIDSVYWLSDDVLIAVGNQININDMVDLFIKIYTINISENDLNIETYIYENAITIGERNSLKLSWLEQRTDYFEHDN